MLVQFDDGLFSAPAYNVRELKECDEYDHEAMWDDGKYYGCVVIFEGMHVVRGCITNVVLVNCMETNAPINIKPHYPPPGHTWGNSGGFDLKNRPTSGAFDSS